MLKSDPCVLSECAMASRHLVWLALLCCCSYVFAEDPEVNYDALRLITSKGYRAEVHYVTTTDGYILCLHRIPCPQNQSCNVSRPVVFLQHGLLCSSTNWLTNLRNESLGFILADAGFDVWMGNVRGNTYSRNHTTLSPDSRAFWNFSFDAHLQKDLPAMVDYTLTVSKQKQLFYVGHSQGTVMGFGGFTFNKTLAAQVKAFFALAPVAMVTHVQGAFYLLSKFYKQLEVFLDVVGDGEFFPNSKLIDWFAQQFCPFDKDIEQLCENVLFLICGFDVNNMNLTRLPVYYSHTPAGTSVKNAAHFAQEVRSGKFEMYDYGSAEDNMKHYGVPHPPPYNVTELTVKTALFTGGQDWLADPTDVANLIPKIKDVVFYHKNISYYDHLDFIWGLDAATQVYSEIITQIKNML